MSHEAKIFQESLQKHSTNIFFYYQDQKVSYQDFWQKVQQASFWLKGLHIPQGSLILLNIQNPLLFLSLTFACFHHKIIPGFLNSYFKDLQILNLLNENTYSCVITDTPKKFPITTHIYKPKGFLHSYKPDSLEIPLDSKMIFYSSGSIQSKACVLELQNFFYNALGSLEQIPFTNHDIWGASLPLFHVGGFSVFIRTFLSHASTYWVQKDISLLDQLKRYSVTHLSLVSTQFIRFLEELKNHQQNTSLKYLLLGGSAIAQKYLDLANKLNLPVLKSYGMTEMASQIYTNQVLPYREIKILNQEILLKGKCLFNGYIRNNQISSPVDKEGWFHSGDLGIFQGNKLIVIGRKDRIFQSGGENISPELIEKELLKINGIEKAYVLPEEDPQYGLRAIAYLETVLPLEQIDNLLKENLSGLYRPKKYLPWNQLPKKSWKL